MFAKIWMWIWSWEVAGVCLMGCHCWRVELPKEVASPPINLLRVERTLLRGPS